MTNYARAYDNPRSQYHRVARALADKLRQETDLTTRGVETGVLRWKSTGRVVQADCVAFAYYLGIAVSRAACNRVREREDAAAFVKHIHGANVAPQPCGR